MTILTWDKFRESKYYLNRVIASLMEIEYSNYSIKTVQDILYLRYDLNSYINASRATTFVLQKEYRSAYGNEFDTLYSEIIQTLIEHNFSNSLKELRNMNQKEGNKYPTFEFVSELENSNFYFELDFTATSGNIFPKQRLESKGVKYTKPLFTTTAEISEDKFLEILHETYRDAVEEVNLKKNFKLHKLKVDKLSIDLSARDFIQQCIEVNNIIHRIIKDCETKFK